MKEIWQFEVAVFILAESFFLQSQLFSFLFMLFAWLILLFVLKFVLTFLPWLILYGPKSPNKQNSFVMLMQASLCHVMTSSSTTFLINPLITWLMTADLLYGSLIFCFRSSFEGSYLRSYYFGSPKPFSIFCIAFMILSYNP